MALLLVKTAGMTLAEARALTVEEAMLWLECAAEVERELGSR